MAAARQRRRSRRPAPLADETMEKATGGAAHPRAGESRADGRRRPHRAPGEGAGPPARASARRPPSGWPSTCSRPGPAYAEAPGRGGDRRGARRALLLDLPDPHRRGSLRHLLRRGGATRGCSAWWRGCPTWWPSSAPTSSAAATTCCTARSRRSTAWARPTSRSASCWCGSRPSPVEEIVVATNPDVEGEATALYLARLLKPLGDEGDAASPRASPWAAISSTPTRSPWRAPSPAGASCERRAPRASDARDIGWPRAHRDRCRRFPGIRPMDSVSRRVESRDMNSGLVMYEEEFRLISGICDRLTRDANAKVVFIVDKNGQLIAVERPGPEPRHHLARLAHRRQRRRHGRARQAHRRERVRQPVPRGRDANAPHEHRGQPGHPGRHLRRQELARPRSPAREEGERGAGQDLRALLAKKQATPGAQQPVRRDHRRRHRQPLQRA